MVATTYPFEERALPVADEAPPTNNDHIEFEAECFPAQSITEVIPGLAWVATDMLTAEECEEWIQFGEQFGLGKAQGTFRTSKRTKNFQNQAMSDLAGARLPADLIRVIESTGMCTQMRGLHPNWRIVRYDEGDQFPAHQDQQDELATKREDGTIERVRSTHTVLVSLSGCSGCVGGATRFFPAGTCDKTVDVCLPQGAVLIFQQKSVLHSGMPVMSGTKYVAQVGLLRALPSTGKAERPHVFKFGLGLNQGSSESDAAEALQKQGQLYSERYCRMAPYKLE